MPQTMTVPQPPTAEGIRALLIRSNVAVEEAVLRIYSRQTADEQEREVTRYRNGEGFNAFDAGIMSSFARQVQQNRWGRPKGQRLTTRQMVIARRKIVRYTGQLLQIALRKYYEVHPEELIPQHVRNARQAAVEYLAAAATAPTVAMGPRDSDEDTE